MQCKRIAQVAAGIAGKLIKDTVALLLAAGTLPDCRKCAVDVIDNHLGKLSGIFQISRAIEEK